MQVSSFKFQASSFKLQVSSFKFQLFIFAVCILTGCPDSGTMNKNDYLIRVEDSIMTPIDFKKALDIAKTAYPYDIVDNNDEYNKVKTELLKELCERMIVLERARELNITISDAEIEKDIADIKSGYPEGEFKKALLEAAVSYDSWKNERKARLLMQKVVVKELEQKIDVSNNDITEYHDNDSGEKERDSKEISKDERETIRKHLLIKKTEQAYKSWITNLRQKYTIKINEEQWKKIVLE
ncbi:MAG: hypothetical protein GY749_15170 [Desulfobacteraceae bacterium]|nr:hypothetical protein [Desulfobacteraceae bacterium]